MLFFLVWGRCWEEEGIGWEGEEGKEEVEEVSTSSSRLSNTYQ